MKTTLLLLVAMTLLVITLTGCAPSGNELEDIADEDGEVAGFWLGLWHGIIAPITLLLSLFYDSVHMYEVHNNGGWYNLGFLLGATVILGGGFGGAGRRTWRG